MSADSRQRHEAIKASLDLRTVVLQSHPEAKRQAKALRLRCISPTHKDEHPSMFVYERTFRCFACDFKGDLFDWLEVETKCSKSEALKQAANLAHIDLPSIHSSPGGCTLADYAAAKRLPEAFLRSMGLKDVSYNNSPAIRIPFYAPDGREISTQYRVRLNKVPGGDGRFLFKKGAKAAIYGQDRPFGEQVVLVEGVSDVQTLRYHGIAACGLPGASQWKEDRDAPLFENVQKIFVVLEPDTGGETLKRHLSGSSVRAKVHLVTLPNFKDVSAMHIADEAHFKERFAAASERAVALDDTLTLQLSREREEAYEAAKELLHDPHLFGRIKEVIQDGGYAGDLTPPLMAYAAVTSRILPRPINLSFVAPSAAGKNRAVDDAVRLMPPEAVYQLSAGSPRALIYEAQSFEHVTVVLREADSISFSDDGSASSAIRAIVDDNQMRYAVVEKDSEGRQRTRSIEKPGPTGLITTSIKSVGHQLGTRLLEMPILDSEEQTRRVLDEVAKRAAGHAPKKVDLAPFHALQRYLARSDARVVVPFAEELFRLIPANVVRMRRDAPKLISGIQAIALLYQCQRERDAEDRVIATVDDYGVARELLAPAFEIIQGEGLTPAVREAVTEIRDDERGITVAELGRRLGLSPTATRYRVKRAVADGWLVDEEERDRRGRSARLRRGQPLPEAKSPLPEVASLCQATTPSRFPLPGDRSDVTPVFGIDPPHGVTNRQTANTFREADAPANLDESGESMGLLGVVDSGAVTPTESLVALGEFSSPSCRKCAGTDITYVIGFLWKCESCGADVWTQDIA
jgi:MarR family/CHC2 zinc finger